MRKSVNLIMLIALVLTISFCEKEAEISPERFKLLTDTVATEMDFEPWGRVCL